MNIASICTRDVVGDLAKYPPVAVPGSASLQEAVAAMEKAGVRRLLVVDEQGGVIGLVSSDDIVCALSEELEGLARALRRGIQREKSERKVFAAPSGARPVFPSFGTAALQQHPADACDGRLLRLGAIVVACVKALRTPPSARA